MNDKLLQAAQDSQAAVAAGALALTLVEHGTLTRAVAETTFVDMTRQLASAQKTLIELELASPDQRVRRDATTASVNDATAAVLAGRDCLQTDTSCTSARHALAEADNSLTKLISQLEADQ